MTTVDVTSSHCQACGSIVAGRFCSACGAEFRDPSSSGPVGHLVDEFINEPGAGYFGALREILRSPVHGTLRLVDNLSFRAHKSFFFTNSAIVLAVATAIYKPDPPGPDDSAIARHLSEALGHYSALVMTITQYISVFGGFLIGFWIFRAFARNRRSAGEFFKLTCLTAGFSGLLNAARQLPDLALLVFGANLFGGENSPLHIGIGIAALLISIYIVYYTIHCQKLFWELSLGRVLLSSVLVLMVVTAVLLAQFIIMGVIAGLAYG